MIERAERYGDLEEIIELALNEIEVAPSLRDRARENLRRIARSQGVNSIIEKIEEARDRKHRAQAWLSGVMAPESDIDWKLRQARNLDPALVQQKAWMALARLAQKKPTKAWAQLVSNAVATLSSLDEVSVLRDVNGAERACIDLIAAAEAPDFKDESDVIQGLVFAETANLYTICAKVTREKSFVERGLFLYSMAADAISKGSSPLALMVVQINRGAALTCYAHLIQKQHFDKYKRDIFEVFQYIGDEVMHSNNSNEYNDLAKSVYDDLGIISSFGNSFSEWSRWSDIGSCSIDMLVDNEAEKIG
ncbi:MULTISPECIES: hypothetical protein [Rhizobium/Agrobacterium group]|uniref:hypothetical protein n=1 Tax=Rhizobium/Agrobacterium group TaxID=227290 RepID=UPI002300585E|nr:MULTISPECIES: hypothetical protein [Rhizobium/Agrobacterium group]MDA5633702.1 hypothetical protein [Agrobacterium sp. ST15.16.024]MDF1892257.1 hypothetical protein [Rhizobium rhizogenes]